MPKDGPTDMNHYLLVGAGGTASYLFPTLHRWLRDQHNEDFLLAVIDGDTIKTHNLARQNHNPTAIGQPKARAIVHGYPHTVAIIEYLGPENIDRYIQEGTTVIITVDNMPARARIQDRANQLSDVTVINAGNEEYTASAQIWLREEGVNVTPPIGFLHPDIAYTGEDRALMSCDQIEALPGGGQTAIANQASATAIMAALNSNKFAPHGQIKWHELHFDTQRGEVEAIDYRSTKAWNLFSTSSASSSPSPSQQDSSSGLATAPPERRTPSSARRSSSPTRR